MARGLHATCEKEDILEDLQQKDLKILDAVNIIKKERVRNGQGDLTIYKKGFPKGSLCSLLITRRKLRVYTT